VALSAPASTETTATDTVAVSAGAADAGRVGAGVAADTVSVGVGVADTVSVGVGVADTVSVGAGVADTVALSAASTSAVSTVPASTGAVPAGPGVASTAGGLTTVPAPADPPTTELRGPVTRPAEAPYAVADRVPVAGPLPSNIYRARRPGVAILLIIPAVAVGVLLVQALATSAFGDSFDIAGILASVSALVSLPFLVAGLYGLISGAAHGAEQYGFRVWARPPLAYLLVGLAFVAAAGLAIG